jgi:phosphoglycolate phosphatase-like HAD superfamily hydrolase
MGSSDSSIESCVFSGIDVVVFDLDGTLLDSEKLVEGDRRRTPYDLLRFTGDSDETTPLKKWKDVQKHLSYLIQCGIKVAVITESPKAYASTACFLLGIDFHILIPHSADPSLNTKSKKLEFLSSGLKPEPQSSVGSATWNPGTKMLYVGNTRNDKSVATDLSIYYQDIHDFLNLKTSNLKRFLRHMSDVVEAELAEDLAGSCRHSKHSSARRSAQRTSLQHLSLDRENAGNVSSFSEITLNIPAECVVFYELEETKPYLRPILHPDFVTRYEYEHNEPLLSRLFHALHAQFGSHSIDTSKFHKDLANMETFAHLSYRHSLLGQKLWLRIKDWKGTSSGPEVSLLHLEFIAICMSASISIESKQAVIVPTPSSVFSQAKPGRISHRLAKRISNLTGHPYFEAIGRQDGKELLLNPRGIPFESTVILIDDQLTTGGTVSRAVNALSEGGVGEIEIRVWTASSFSLDEDAIKQGTNVRIFTSNSVSRASNIHEAPKAALPHDLKILKAICEAFKLRPSNGKIREATSDEILLGNLASNAKHLLKTLTELRQLIHTNTRDMLGHTLISSLLTESEGKITGRKAKSPLKLAHPEIYRQFVRLEPFWQTMFDLKVKVFGYSPQVEELRARAREFFEFHQNLPRQEFDKEINLFLSHIDQDIAVAKTAATLYATQLKVLLGEDYAIAGVCSWLRHEKEVLKFDLKSFRSVYPELAKEFYP